MSEVARIQDQFRRAYEGEAWHGPSLKEALNGVTAKIAIARPMKKAHTIWEIILHIDATHRLIHRRLQGKATTLTDEQDWPSVDKRTDDHWKELLDRLEESYRDVQSDIAKCKDQDLDKKVTGSESSLYESFHGLIQHDLFHAGQIMVLKKGT